MLRSAIEFFKKEKKYAFLSVLVAGLLIYAVMVPSTRRQEMANSPAIQKFKADEQKLQEQVKEKGALQDYLQGHPEIARQVSALSFAFFLMFIYGLVLDGRFFLNKEWRENLQVPQPLFETTPWRLSMIYKVAILFIVLSFGTGFIFSGLKFLSGNSTDGLNFYLLLHTTLMDVLCFLLVKKVITDAGGNWREMGFRLPEGKPLKEIFFAWGAYAAVIPIFAVILMALIGIAHMIHYEPPPHPLVNVFLEEEQRGKPLIVYSILLATVIGPIFEEIFFRGFCYKILKHRFGVKTAMISSSAFFALIHENSFAFWPIFVLGMILCYIYEKRQSLLAPMVLHVTHNLIFIYYFFLAKDIVKLVG